jgi:hypothetical protein
MKLLSVLLFLFVSLFGTSQVTLHALSTPFPNSNLYVGQFDSQLTENISFVAETKTNSDGGFQLDLDAEVISEFTPLFLCIQNTTAMLYVAPNGKYHISYSEPDTLSTHNGFIKHWSILVQEEADLPYNSLFADFEMDLANFTDSIYFPYITLYTSGNTAVKKRIQENSVNFAGTITNNDSLLQLETKIELSVLTAKFQNQIREKYKVFMDSCPYLTSHIESSMMAFRFVQRGFEFGNLLVPYFNFKSQGFGQILNVWSSQLIAEILSNPVKADQFRYLLSAESDFNTIMKLLNPEHRGNSELSELRVVNMLRLAYFSNAFDRNKIKYLFQNIQANSKNESVQKFASMCLGNVDQDLKGKIVTEIELEDLRGKNWSLKKNLDRYTYIYFFDESIQCKKELSFLNKIQDKYAEAIEVFAVYVGNNPTYLQEIHDTYGSDLNLLTANFDFKTLHALHISSIPCALQMNAKGEIMYSYTFLPSEKIIKEWNGIMRKL